MWGNVKPYKEYKLSWDNPDKPKWFFGKSTIISLCCYIGHKLWFPLQLQSDMLEMTQLVFMIISHVKVAHARHPLSNMRDVYVYF